MSSLKTRLTNLAHAKEVAELKTKLDQSIKDLAATTTQLEHARTARFDPIKPAATRPKLKGDIVRLIVSDVHGCKADKKAIAALLADIKTLQPQNIILNGDIIDCGGFLAQHHTMGYVAETLYSYEDDIAQTKHFLDALREAAPNALIEYIEGNHENRIERWCITETLRHTRDSEFLRTKLAPQFVLELKERGIPYYRMCECYDGLSVPGFIKRGKIHYTHGSFVTAKHATAKIHARVNGNVVFGNTHRVQAEVISRVGAGSIGAYNPGCLCELNPVWQNTNPTDWTHGYGVEFIARSESFLHINIPIVDGQSLLVPFLSSHELAA